MSDDLKAKSNEELVAHLESLAQTSFWNASDRPLRDAHRAELLRRLEAGAKAEAALKLAETTRESWKREAEALEQEIEGLRAERDHHRQANEALRARVAGLEDAERIAWALSNTVRKRFDLPCLTLTDPAISVSVWVLCVNGQKRYFTVEDDEGYFIPADKYPRITPKARALIDAAREAGKGEAERG